MRQVVIENPVINSAFVEPLRHFRFTDEGITDEIVEGRRASGYFVPVPRPKKRGKQLQFDTQWTQDRFEENDSINRIRARVKLWRERDYTPAPTRTTRRLLEYWTHPDRENKLFFCQIEAMETAIYLTEVAGKAGDAWIENEIRKANEEANPGLYRVAFKMATGSGKTVLMAMLIAWQTLNRLANRQDRRFSDTFLVVTPGITIRDRLRVLLPNDPNNYYIQRDLLPPGDLEKLGEAKILITNFHAFIQREKISAGKLTKDILAQGKDDAFKETPDQMVRRVCRELGNKKNVVVINDEAHHCYRHKVDGEEEKLTGDDRKEAESREAKAHIWISGLEAVTAKIGTKAIYDLSATPFFLRGSGYREGLLFPWVVSDFSLIDAIECGIVKVPRVPVADNAMTGELPTYRDIWTHIREHLPRKGRGKKAVTGEPQLPKELQGALHSLYDNYRKQYEIWEQNEDARRRGSTPPVFIVVCNNTNVSKLVFDYIAGWEKPLKDDKTVLVPGQLPIFSNVENGQWTPRPNTILIDSEQLESGEAMSREFKKIAAAEIEEFKSEYRARFPGRDPEKLTDEDLLREVMNTVGKQDRLGEQIKCVVSVSMLTEGWDANTVTHILGVRAFGTQLLCEQVVGRGLRRVGYVPEKRTLTYDGKTVEFEGYPPQYAEVYGVPFSFIPCSGSAKEPRPGPTPTHVRALPERIACEITFPRVSGYRYDLPDEVLTATFTEDSEMSLSTTELPTKTEISGIVGLPDIHTLDDLKRRREQEVAFFIAKRTLENYFRDDEGNLKQWLFPQLLNIAKRWLKECLTCKDNTFPQLLLLIENSFAAADRIYKSVVASHEGEKALKPILFPYDTVGSTQYVDFFTTRPVYETAPDFCHVSHVVGDTESWEQKVAQVLEELGREGFLVSYVKNQGLNFAIPYLLNGEEHNYIPDFIARMSDGHGPDDLLNLIIEVSGQRDEAKATKVSTARNLWVPAINNHGGFGRWEFIEVTDPWDCSDTLAAFARDGEET